MKGTRTGLAFALVLGLACGTANASTVALQFEDCTEPCTERNAGTDRTYGWAFSVNSPITVVGLGYFDNDSLGLEENHSVQIWNSDGSQVLLSGTVPSGTTGQLINGFRYTGITPFELGIGSYVIGAYVLDANFPEEDIVAVNQKSVTTDSRISYIEPRRSPRESGFIFPEVVGEDGGYFGPNMLLAVPEPATLALFGVGFAGLGALRKKLVH